MTQFKKPFCVYHPQQLITNFCRDKNCLMPLCPSCIGSHNDYHDKNSFRANYINIFDALAQVQTLIYNTIVNLEQDKKRNDQIIYLIHNLNDIVKSKITQAKELAISVLQKGFQNLQNQLLNLLDQKHEEAGIFSISKSKKFQTQLIQNIQDLYQMAQNLKTDKSLSSLIKYHSQKHVQLTSLHNMISSSLYANQSYTPQISIDEQSIQNLLPTINRFVNIQFNFPVQLQKIGSNIKVGQSRLVKNSVSNQKQTYLNNNTSRNSRMNQQKMTPPRPTQLTNLNNFVPSYTLSNQKPRSPIRNQSGLQTIIKHQGQVINSPIQKQKKSLIGLPNNYDIQFENLSKKVRQMRKQNELLSRALKNF